MELRNKTVIITGGCKGFGKALAKDFIAENSKVIISSNDQEELTKTAKELGVDSFLADVTNPIDVEKLADYTVGKFGRIDIWINNAGVQIAPSKVEDVDTIKLRQLFNINFLGYFYGCQVALRQMKKQIFGTIININSTAGLEGKPELSAYCSSKYALRGLSEVIRSENPDGNIQVIDVHPGGMQTDIYKEKYPKDLDQYMLVDDVSNKAIENLKLDRPQDQLTIKRPKK